MKKFFLSAVVMVTFIGYALFLRVFREVNEAPVGVNLSSPTSSSVPTSAAPLPTTPAGIPAPTSQHTNASPTSAPRPASGYKDGIYIGDPADAFYGNIQVQVTIAGGRIKDVKFLQFPSDRGTSIEINQQADPILAQEAIQVQSANVDIVSGATDSSQAFIQSMHSALNKAKS
ncbi:MAG TPA: FMN-binding protein [Patescibacteria group bacterium]